MLSRKNIKAVLIILPAFILLYGFYLATLQNTNNLNKASKENKQAVNYVQATNLNLEKFKQEHSDIYSGLYTDTNGINLVLVEGSKVEEISQLKNSGIIIHYAKYSLKKLQSILEILSPKAVELGIQSIGIDEKNNIVEIYIQNMTDDKVNIIKQVCDSPAIVFKNAVGQLQFNFKKDYDNALKTC